MIKPTSSELKILQILWERGSATVRDVHQYLHGVNAEGYTTTLKLMQIMTQKGLTERDTTSRTHIYRPLISESSTKGMLVKNFIMDTFRGCATSLVIEALGQSKATPEELDEIKRIINQIENKES